MNPVSVDYIPFFPGTVMRYLSGERDTKCSLDTLKKEYGKPPFSKKGKESKDAGFWQVLPQRAVHDPLHLSWCVFSVLSSLHSHTLRFRQPELELLARVAGTFQWAEAKSRAALRDSDQKVVLVWVGPASALSPASFSQIAQKWGLRPQKWVPAPQQTPEGWVGDSRAWAVERSALAGLE